MSIDLVSMRTWAIACTVIILLLLIPLGVEYRLAHRTVPPGIQRADCLTPAPDAENGYDELSRLGGHITRFPNAQWTEDGYTTRDIAQGRTLSRYETLVLRDPEPRHVWEMKADDPLLAQARTFLWSHWHNRKPAYLVLTLSSIDATSTWHLFVESDDSGRWRVFRRLLRRRELVDQPTAYSLEWVVPNGSDKPGTPLSIGQGLDPMNNKIEFRDVCGEILGSF